MMTLAAGMAINLRLSTDVSVRTCQGHGLLVSKPKKTTLKYGRLHLPSQVYDSIECSMLASLHYCLLPVN